MGTTGLRHPFVTGLNVLFVGVDSFFYAECPNAATVPTVGNILAITSEDVETARTAVDLAARSALKSLIWIVAAKKRADATVEYHSSEISAGASYKIEQARAILAGGTGALIEAEATARGISTSALATKITAAYDRLTALEASVAGYSGKLADAVDAAVDDPRAALRTADTEQWMSDERL